MMLWKSSVVFDEVQHRYFLGDKELKGVTSTLIRRAFPDKYKDVDPEVLANAARKGKELHEMIEYHDHFCTAAEEHPDQRIANYERLKKENNLRTIANEYLVSDEEHYASSVDIVMLNDKNEICLVDTKTTYNLDLESVALQLSIYRRFFEKQNPQHTVAHIYVLWLPNKDHTIAELRELSFVSDDTIDALIWADLHDEPFDIAQSYGTLPARLSEVEDEIIRIECEAKLIKQRSDELKRGLYDLMERNNVKSFQGAKVKLTRVLPTTSETFDSKRLKAEHPEIYRLYVRETQRSGSLKITIS